MQTKKCLSIVTFYKAYFMSDNQNAAPAENAPNPNREQLIQNTKNQFFKKGDPDFEETSIFTDFVALFHFVDKSYAKVGDTGHCILRILKNDSNGRYRLLARSRTNFDNVILHFYVLPGNEIREKSLKEKGNVVIKAENYADPENPKVEFYWLRFHSDESKQSFIEKYNEALNANNAILTALAN